MFKRAFRRSPSDEPTRTHRRSPIRALVSLLACISLIAALGASTAGVAGAAVDVSGNPDLGKACGLDFALVIDRSGSVSGAGASLTVRNAAKAFLGALVDTGSRVSLTSFATTATVDNVATPLTTANLAGLNTKVDNLAFGNFTNWEDALIKAQSTFGAFTPAGRPQLVVVITDGNPNRWMNGNTVSSSGGTATSLAEAVGRATTIKAGGTHMFALGVAGDSGLNTTALQAISGTDAYPAQPFASADWTSVSSFNDLQKALLDIATDLCGGTVVVHKLVDGQPAGAGWHFAAPGGTSTPGTGDTGSDGIVNFAWDSPQSQATDLTETQKAGYTLASASCLLNGNATGSAIPNGVHLSVGPRDTVQCTFNNRTLRAGINVEKTASPTVLTVNGLATYTYVVTNAAEAPLGSVVVSDDKCSPMSLPNRGVGDNGNSLLEVGETWTYTCATPLAVDTTNTATATGTPPVGPAVTDTDTATVDVVNPGLDIVKTGPAQAREGETVTYHFAVHNTGDIPLSGIVVTDDVIGAIGTIPTLAAGATVTLDKIYTIPAGHPSDVVNIGSACVSAAVLGNTPLCDGSTHTLDVLHPAIHVAKSVNKPVVTAGTTVTYSYVVTNPGDVALSGVSLTDDKCAAVTATGGDTDHDNFLDVGETWTYACSAALSVDTVNIATAKGTPPVGPDVTGTGTASVDVVHPGLTVVKTGPAQAREGDIVTYHFAVTNTGDVTLAHIAVSDDILGLLNADLTLIAGQTVTLDKNYTVPSGRSADVVNVASACVSGAPGLGNTALCDSDTHTLDVLHPAIHVAKSVNKPVINPGGSVTYSYAVTNPGDIALAGVTVADDKCSPVAFSGGDTDSDGLLDLGETWTYHCSATLAVDTLNTATSTGTPPVGPAVTDTDTALVDVVNPNLHVDKTGPAQAHEGDTVTYTFTVTNTGDVTLANLSVVDDVLGTIGTIESLAAGHSSVLTRTYTIPTGQIGDVVNTVLVCIAGSAPGVQDGEPLCDTEIHVLDVLHPAITIDKASSVPSVGTAGTVTYSYVVRNTGDAALHNLLILDDILGAIGTLGSLAPGESVTMFKTVTVDASTPPTNIGTATGTDVLGKTVTATDSVTITVVLGETITRPVELPRTGAPLQAQTWAALAMIQVGVVLTLAGRRRRVAHRAV